MNNSKTKEKKDYRSMIIIGIVVIIVAILLVLIIKTLVVNDKPINSTDVNKMIKDKQTAIIYVENSDSKKCDKCSIIKKHLDSEGIKYTTYDTNKVDNDDYKTFLKSLYIDSKIFNYPAVIYIKDGSMYANIINIVDNSVVDQFVKDYDLKKIK